MQTKQLRRWYLILAAIVLGFIVYVTLKYNNVEQDSYRWNEIIKFNDGWMTVDDNGETIPTNLPLKDKVIEDQTYIISNTLPNNLEEGSALCFKSDHLHVKAYVNEIEIYSLDVDEHSTISKSPGCSYVLIPLSSNMSGKTLRLEYKAVYTGASFHMSEFYLGDKSTIITGIIREKAIPILICSLIFCLGLIFIVSYLIKRKTYDMNKSLLYLGMFAMPLAVWSMTETQTMQFFFTNVYAMQYVTYLSLALCPVPFLLFYSEQHNLNESKVVKIGGNACLLVTVLCLILQAIGVVDLPKSLVLVHISIAFILGYALYHTIREFVMSRRKVKQLTLTKISMVLMLTCCLIDLTRYYFGISHDYSKFIRIGFLLYLGCTGLGTIFQSVQVNKKNKELEQLAYLDPTTGFYNPVAFSQKMEELEEDTKLGLIELEILELDELEEEFGSQARNEVLLSASKMVERAFHNIGTIYRYSENQFMITLSENIEKAYADGIQNLKKRVHNSNKSRGQKINLADTFVIYNSNNEQDISTVIEDMELSLRNVKKIKETTKA